VCCFPARFARLERACSVVREHETDVILRLSSSVREPRFHRTLLPIRATYLAACRAISDRSASGTTQRKEAVLASLVVRLDDLQQRHGPLLLLSLYRRRRHYINACTLSSTSAVCMHREQQETGVTAVLHERQFAQLVLQMRSDSSIWTAQLFSSVLRTSLNGQRAQTWVLTVTQSLYDDDAADPVIHRPSAISATRDQASRHCSGRIHSCCSPQVLSCTTLIALFTQS